MILEKVASLYALYVACLLVLALVVTIVLPKIGRRKAPVGLSRSREPISEIARSELPASTGPASDPTAALQGAISSARRERDSLRDLVAAEGRELTDAERRKVNKINQRIKRMSARAERLEKQAAK